MSKPGLRAQNIAAYIELDIFTISKPSSNYVVKCIRLNRGGCIHG